MKSKKRLDILVNNVGDYLRKGILETSPEEWDSMIKSNLFSVYNGCHICAPIMKLRGWGRIVNLACASADIVTAKRDSAYLIAKMGVILLTKTYARELAKYGVTVNAVSPGIVDRLEFSSRKRYEEAKLVPASRLQTADEIAEAVLHFVLADGSVTGSNLIVSGGLGV